jgi:uracil-DNA glycosylase family 4
VKASGRHAAGVCVSKHDLRTGENANFVVRKGVNVCNWDKEDAEYMGLMKLDVLGLNALTILSEAKDLIKDRHGIDLDYNLIDLDDDKIYEQFTAGNTVGIFQFGSGSMIKLCRDIHGENFDQVVAINALHRPGALRSGYTQIYRDRKFGTVDTEYVHPWIEGITKDTQGLIIYQEQVMRLMYELGGLPWKTADTIRKVISKSKGVEEFMKFEEEFIAGCKRLGTLSESDAKTIFGELKNTGSYSFNKSHACEYSLTGVWQMYLKVYYPIEFMTALLSYGPANKKGELINEAKRLGIKINLPDINKSMADTWAIGDDNSLLSPLREVKGIGEVASKEIVECRGMQGAFKDDLDLESKVEKRKVNKKVRDLLVKVKAYEKSKDKLNLPEDELEELSQYFDFELSNDPLHRYRGAIAKIANNIGLINLSESYNTGDKSNFFFGRMDSLRVGYRAAVGQTAGSGSFGSMGGVYGNLKDDTDFKMLIFGNKIYNEKKDVIEHCEGEAILTYAYNSDDKAALMTQNAWFGDEILSGDLDGVKPELGDFTKNDLSGTYLDGCDGCELIKECTSPVYPSNGQMNVMLIGEAPGRLEDKKGMGFIGQSGKILWDIFREYRLSRELFYINNVVKCFPSITKTPKKKHVTACSKWLKREIDIVKPFLILSFGNTGNLFFRGESTGIMSINATTAWNNEYNCWITYSVHPAMATYNPENLPLLEESISEFAKKLEILM